MMPPSFKERQAARRQAVRRGPTTGLDSAAEDRMTELPRLVPRWASRRGPSAPRPTGRRAYR